MLARRETLFAHARGAFVARVSFAIMDEQLHKPKWLDGIARQTEENVPMRVTIEIWDSTPPHAQDDIHSVVICVDGQVVGKPLTKEDGRIVLNWLSSALGDIEKQVLEEVERLELEDFHRAR